MRALSCAALALAAAACRDAPLMNGTLGTGVDVHQLALVSDGRALGSSANPKFIIDEAGRALVAVRTHVGIGQVQQFGIGLVQGLPGGTARTAFLADAAGLDVSHAAQGAPSFDTLGDGYATVLFSGGTVAQPAHQLRAATFVTSPDLRALTASQVLTITGFDLAYPSASGTEPWQEFPSAAYDSSGRLHVAWEARDAVRLAAGSPVPAIAHVVLPLAGGANPQRASPPYLDAANGSFSSQRRPVLIADGSGGMHVLASSGPLIGNQQAIYGHLDAAGVFSGFTAIAPDASVDQRHVVGARDSSGALWVAWRQGVPGGTAGGGIGVFATRRLADATAFETPVQVSDPADNASAPSVAANGGNAHLAFVSWVPGAPNSDNRIDNGFPQDEGLIEGTLRLFEKRERAQWRPVAVDQRTTTSYPAWASGPAGVPSANALLFTEGFATSCPGADCVSLQYGAVQEPQTP